MRPLLLLLLLLLLRLRLRLRLLLSCLRQSPLLPPWASCCPWVLLREAPRGGAWA